MGSSHVLNLRAAGYVYECPECGQKNVEPYVHRTIICGNCRAVFTQVKAFHVKGKDPQTQDQIENKNSDSITF